MSIKDVHAIMEGMEKYVVSGAVPGLRNVVYHSPENGAFTDGDTIHLPLPSSKMTDNELLLWRYYAEHEMGHEDPVNASPHWKSIMQEHKAKHPELFWKIANLISDHVQEHNRVGVMVGRDDVLLRGRLAHTQRDLGEAERAGAMEDGFMSGLFMYDWEQRKEWNPHIAAAGKAWRKHYPQAEEWVGKYAEAVHLPSLKNEQEVYEAAKKLYALLPEEERKKAEEAPKPVPGMASKHGLGEPTDEDEKKKEGATECSPTLEYTEGAFFARVPVPLEKAWERCSWSDSALYEESSYRNGILGLLKKTNLPAKVRAFLLSRKVAKYSTGYRSGKLDTNRLTDVLRNRDDVFRRKESVRMVNTAVYLLVDASGSMCGSNYTKACAAGIMLAEALQGVKVNIEIAGFTEFGMGQDTLIHETVCRFGQRFVRERAVSTFAKLGNALNENADGENLLYAYHRIKQQDEERKLIIIISDGQPSAGGHPNNAGSRGAQGAFCKQVAKQIDEDKNVELWAIGIGGHVPTFYKNFVSLGHSGLETTLLDLVKRTLVKG